MDKLPRVGETLCGHKLAICCGGKGANQAVTAARMAGANNPVVSIIGKVRQCSLGNLIHFLIIPLS